MRFAGASGALAGLILAVCAASGLARAATDGAATRTADLRGSASLYGIASWDTDRGLPQNTVQAIAQTSDGYLWIGTKEGLARFNGTDFTVFDSSNTAALPNAAISALLEGPDGSLWIGTDGGGVVRFQGGNFRRFGKAEGGLSRTRIVAVARGPEGSLWFATSSTLDRLHAGRITSFTRENGLPRSGIRALHIDAAGSVWVATSGGTRVIVDGNVVTDAGNAQRRSGTVRAIHVDRAGVRWSASTSEILREEGGTFTRFETKAGVDPKLVQRIYEDRAGVLWFGTSEGLFRFDRGRFVRETAKGGLSSDSILALQEDREGNLWLGTTDGLKQLRATAFSSYTTLEGLPHNVVTTVCEDAAGALWIATNGGGLLRWIGGKKTRYSTTQGLASGRIRALHPTSDGSIWVGVETAKIHRIKDGSVDTYDCPEQAGNWHAAAILQDRHGVVHMGAKAGLARLEGESFVAVAGENAPSEIRAMVEDAEGLWIGTSRGLARLVEGKFVALPDSQRLATLGINTLHTDGDGTLWIGTAGYGLRWLKQGRLHACTTADGLLQDTILAIVDDDQGHLWLTSRQGISRVAKQALERFAAGEIEAVDCVGFDKDDGMLGLEGSSIAKPAAWRARDGRLWFATVKGLLAVDPTRLRSNPVPPIAMITEATVDRVGAAVDQLGRFPAGKGNLRFRFAALSFTHPERVRFKYRLEGVDEDWVFAGTRREATYSGVSPGRRRFEVMARSSAGVWSTSAAAYEFHLAPHYYETWWFYGIAGIGLAATAAGAFQLRVRTLQRRQEELASTVRERTETLKQEIEERRRVEEALKGSEALYHSLVEFLPVSIYRKDTDGRFTFANEHFARTTGFRPEAILGKTDRDLYPPETAERYLRTDAEAMQSLLPVSGEVVDVQPDGEKRWWEYLKIAVTDAHGRITGTQGLFWEITARKRAEEEATRAHRELIEISRRAGMAEVATGVLHNVGNVLNSVNVSATLVADRLRESKTANIVKLSALLQEHRDDLTTFLTRDPRGQQVPAYLDLLARHEATERTATIGELEALRKNIEHIKDIVAMQQNYATVSGVAEPIPLVELVEDALRMNSSSLMRHEITVVRDIRAKPTLTVEKHKVLQVLVNLIRNAQQACDEARRDHKTITISVRDAGDHVEIAVADNGVGIAPENLTRIFGHGFSTRKSGHGFGLHSGALAAQDLGGELSAHSDGLNQGAVFTLRLPRARRSARTNGAGAPAADNGYPS